VSVATERKMASSCLASSGAGECPCGGEKCVCVCLWGVGGGQGKGGYGGRLCGCVFAGVGWMSHSCD